MNTNRKSQNEQGFTLLLALGFLVAMAILAAFTASRSIAHTNAVNRGITFDQTILGIESAREAIISASGGGATAAGIGLDPAIYRFLIDNDLDGQPDALNLPDPDPTFPAGTLNPVAGVTWQALAGSVPGQSLEYVALALEGDNDGLDNDGADTDGDGNPIDDPEEAGFTSYFMAVRVVQNGNVVGYRAAEDINAPGDNLNIWQNAIFANIGQGGALINGNVSIHGSVHLLGNDPNAAVVTAMDLSGTSFVHNNYGEGNQRIPADLEARIPALELVDADGDGILDDETLNAELRVKQGQVNLSGNSEIGEADSGSGTKETMDGVYVDNGGNDSFDTGATAVEDKVFSDNGTQEGYDLGDLIEFPTYENDQGEVFITEDYFEGFNVASWTDPNTGTVHAVSNPGTDELFVGDITLTAGDPSKKDVGGNSFYWNATTGELVDVGGASTATPDSTDVADLPSAADLATATASGENFIFYDSATGEYVTNGRIPVDGNFTFEAGNGQNDTFNYTGKGTILAVDMDDSGDGGTTTVNAQLLTTGFPDTNLLGIMSQNDFNVGGASQYSIMGGFYAQGTVSTDFQTNIVGTIAGNYFDMGSQVPNIYQVPALALAWTDAQRMIGSDPIIFPNPLAYREYQTNLRGN